MSKTLRHHTGGRLRMRTLGNQPAADHAQPVLLPADIQRSKTEAVTFLFCSSDGSVLFYMKMQLLEGRCTDLRQIPIPGLSFFSALRVVFDHHSHFASCGAGRTAAACCST